jgi:hypothetical protein
MATDASFASSFLSSTWLSVRTFAATSLQSVWREASSLVAGARVDLVAVPLHALAPICLCVGLVLLVFGGRLLRNGAWALGFGAGLFTFGRAFAVVAATHAPSLFADPRAAVAIEWMLRCACGLISGLYASRLLGRTLQNAALVLVAWVAHSLLAPVIEWASVAAGLHLVDQPWLLTLPALTVNTAPHLVMLATVAVCTQLVLGWQFVAAELLFAASQAYRWLLPDALPMLRDLCVATEAALAAETQTVAINGATATHWAIVALAVGAVWLIAIASGGVYVEHVAAAALTSACGCAFLLQGLLAGGQLRVDCVGVDRGMALALALANPCCQFIV